MNSTGRHKSLADGAVASALLKKAGPELQKECKDQPLLEDGDVIITNGYKLPCKDVFHSCPPIWQKGKTEKVKHNMFWTLIFMLH